MPARTRLSGEGKSELTRLQSQASENVLDLDEEGTTDWGNGSDHDDVAELTDPSFALEEIAAGPE